MMSDLAISVCGLSVRRSTRHLSFHSLQRFQPDQPSLITPIPRLTNRFNFPFHCLVLHSQHFPPLASRCWFEFSFCLSILTFRFTVGSPYRHGPTPSSTAPCLIDPTFYSSSAVWSVCLCVCVFPRPLVWLECPAGGVARAGPSGRGWCRAYRVPRVSGRPPGRRPFRPSGVAAGDD